MRDEAMVHELQAAAGETGATFLERVRELAPLIESSAAEAERIGRLPAKLVDAMHAARLFRMLLPRAYGGAEIDPPSFIAVIEAVAKIDASTAWSLCQTSVCATTAAYLPPETAWEIWRDPRGVLAWGPGPGARAVETEGGYRVTASCGFASGGRHATWFAAHCPVFAADGTPRRAADGGPLVRSMLFPVGKARVVEMWDVIGLRGTGSDGFAVEDLFVPEAHTTAREDQAERRDRSPLYGVSSYSLYACGFAAVALGVARSLLDQLLRLAAEKTPRGYRTALRKDGALQADVGEAEARLRAARMYLFGTLGELWEGVQRSGAATLDQRMAVRLAATWTIRTAKEVANIAYDAAGATAVFASNPFERRFRDMHTLAQQVQGRKAHFATVGQYLLGLEPDTTWL